MNAIPILFLLSWVWMLGLSVRMAAVEAPKRSALPPTVGVVPQEAVSTVTGSPKPETQFSTNRQGPQERESNRTNEKEASEQFGGYSPLPVPNNVYGAGLAYGVDKLGNQYILSDLIREANLRTFSISPPFTSYAASIPENQIDITVDQNRWGDLVSRVLFTVEMAAAHSPTNMGDVQIKVLDVRAAKTDLNNAGSAIRDTEFWRRHRDDLVGMRLFVVAETISSYKVFLNFPNTKLEVINQAFGELSKLGPETFVKQGSTSIEIISRLPLTLGYKAIELQEKNSDYQPRTRLMPARYDAGNRSLTETTNEKPPFSVMELLPSTHYTDATGQLATLTGRETYGAVLHNLEQKIFGAGINEVRIYDSGFGFAIATRFEVTERSGTPLSGEERFLTRRAGGKRLRGYYITIAAHPKPNAYVSTTRAQDLFSMKYGITFLPDGMADIPIEPGTSIRVFVLEFEDKSGKSEQVQNRDCARSAQDHMEQSGIIRR